MNIKSISLFSGITVVAVLVLGAMSLQQPATAAETGTTTTTQSDPMQFARGAKAWADTCARCHNMRDARSLRDDQWRAAMAHMRIRAGLTAQESEDILAFLQGSN